MKKGFSLLELIFAIVVIGIIGSFAIPKYMNTRDSAQASTIQRDLVTATTSIQSYYLVNRSIDDISEAITLNANNWTVETKKMTFLDDASTCVSLQVTDENKISIAISDANVGGVCVALKALNITNQTIDLI